MILKNILNVKVQNQKQEEKIINNSNFIPNFPLILLYRENYKKIIIKKILHIPLHLVHLTLHSHSHRHLTHQKARVAQKVVVHHHLLSHKIQITNTNKNKITIIIKKKIKVITIKEKIEKNKKKTIVIVINSIKI